LGARRRGIHVGAVDGRRVSYHVGDGDACRALDERPREGVGDPRNDDLVCSEELKNQ
jgi:hypothetical protein